MLQERLLEEQKKAMKAKDKVRLATLRMARAALQNATIQAGGELSEEQVLGILAKEVKQRRESIPEWEKAGRQEMVEQLRQEIATLEEFLPEQLSEEEVEALAREVIAEVGASRPSDMGRVMGLLMPRLKGRADGKVANAVVKRLLS